MSLPFPTPQSMPKLSDFTSQMLRQPEAQLESMLKQSFNVALPKGPGASLLQFQRGFERTGTPAMPELPFGGTSMKSPVGGALQQLPDIPRLPKIQGVPDLPFGGTSQRTTTPAAQTSVGTRSVRADAPVLAAGRGRERNASALF